MSDDARQRLPVVPLAVALVAGAMVGVGEAAGILWRFYGAGAGLGGWIRQGLEDDAITEHARGVLFGLIVPIHALTALVFLAAAAGVVRVTQRRWPRWGALDTIAILASGFAWSHLYLYWRVPGALWAMPGLRFLPFVASFLLLALVGVGLAAWPLCRGQSLRSLRVWASLVLSPVAPVLWVWLPFWLGAPSAGERGAAGVDARVVLLGIDGLRADVGGPATTDWEGTNYPNAVTPVPATRALWSILWGGDPLHYTTTYPVPRVDELKAPPALGVLEQATAAGLAPRFYADDAGTIGMVGREDAFDDFDAPAAGWHSFFSSNLVMHMPVLAAWDLALRSFPSTNPWVPLDWGLRAAIERGRGSGWVMYHSCLAHQPIVPRREELKDVQGWWTETPWYVEPVPAASHVTPEYARRARPELAAGKLYERRVHNILAAWRPLWHALATDTDYANARRVLFSDHGERFVVAPGGIQLAGVHGYGLAPTESRVLLKIAGDVHNAAVDPAAVSLLDLRDAVSAWLHGKSAALDAPLDADRRVVMRFLSVSHQAVMPDDPRYAALDADRIAAETVVLPGGLWASRLRPSDVSGGRRLSVGWAQGERLEYLRPLATEGADLYRFDGYAPRGVEALDESGYARRVAEVEAALRAGPQP